MKIGIVSELIHERNYSDNLLEKMLRKFNIPSRRINEESFELSCIRQGKFKKITETCTCASLAPNGEVLYSIEAAAVEIPYCYEELCELSEVLLKKYMYSAINKLREHGIERIVFTDKIKEIYATEHLSRQMLGSEFSSAVVCNLCELIKKLSGKCDANPLKTQIGIVCRNYNPKLYELLKSLVFEVGSIRIYTEAESGFSYMCGEVYHTFGAIVNICGYKSFDRVNDFIVCDFDNGVLRFGRDIVVTDIKYRIDIRGYSVKDIEILDLIGEKAEDFGIKYCICEKNRLTI